MDRETWHLEILRVLVSALNTPDTKEMALVECASYASMYSEYQASKKVFRYSVKKDDFRTFEHKNYAVELYLLLKFSLHEYDDGIAYYWKNYKAREKENTLYCLLRHFLCDTEFNALWLREYEKAVAGGVKPREDLMGEYKERKAPNYNGEHD